MATFTCSACNFSKTVSDEMQGKKARCPECNAVNLIPYNSEIEDVSEALEDEQAPKQEPTAQTESATAEPAAKTVPPESDPSPIKSRSNATESSSSVGPSEIVFEPISKGWLMALGAPTALVVLAAIMFVFGLVDIAIICFALGIISFAACSIMYCFNIGKK